MSGNTWALPGGAIDRGETPTQGAIREAEEEIGLPRRSTQGVDPLVLVRQEIAILDHGDWKYTYVIADLLRDFKPRITDDEGLDVEWVPVEDVHRLPLHPDFADAWPQLLQIIYPPPINTDDQVARVDEDSQGMLQEDDQVTQSGDQYMLDENDDEDILSQVLIGYSPQGLTQNNDQNPSQKASNQVLQENSQETAKASDQYILGEDDNELMGSQTLLDDVEQDLALSIDQQVVENVDQHVLQHHNQDVAEVSDDHDVAQTSGQDTVHSGGVEHVDQGVVKNDNQNADDDQDASADQDTGIEHQHTPERPTQAGSCRNYWQYGTHELETGNQARGLPMVYGRQGRHCTRLDHIAFRAMYDLGVPQAFYREVFAFIIEVVAVDRQEMVDWARQTLGLALVANDSKEQMLQDIVLDVWDGLDEENMP